MPAPKQGYLVFDTQVLSLQIGQEQTLTVIQQPETLNAHYFVKAYPNSNVFITKIADNKYNIKAIREGLTTIQIELASDEDSDLIDIGGITIGGIFLKSMCIVACKAKEITSISIPSSLKLYRDQSQDLIITYAPEDAAIDKSLIQWSSSNNDLAYVDSDGNVYAKREGKVIITVKYNNLMAQCELEIINQAQIDDTTSYVLSITNKPTQVFKPGDIYQFYGQFSPNVIGKDIFWRTSDSNVAFVDSNGLMTINNYGIVVITAYSNITTSIDTCIISIINNAVELTNIIIPATLNMTINDRPSISPVIYPSNAEANLKWSTSNPSIVQFTINNANNSINLIPTGFGTANLIVSSGDITSICVITVEAQTTVTTTEDETLTGIKIIDEAKRHVIAINSLDAAQENYKFENIINTKELINKQVKYIAIFCNEYIPSELEDLDCIKYTLKVNGEDFDVLPISSQQNGTKIIKVADNSLDSENVAYIKEPIRSAKLTIKLSTNNHNYTPYISNLKILVGGKIDV